MSMDCDKANLRLAELEIARLRLENDNLRAQIEALQTGKTPSLEQRVYDLERAHEAMRSALMLFAEVMQQRTAKP